MTNEPKDPPGGESMKIRCPACGTKFDVPLAKAESAMVAKCPKGHEVPLMKGL